MMMMLSDPHTEQNNPFSVLWRKQSKTLFLMQYNCLLYTSDAADEGLGVDLGGRRIIKKKNFFQAEDGIRDVERSRGLGDVYKRQV